METAFKVLRSAGYAAHALSVAERAGQPEWILDVLLEDMQSYAEAVAFIGKYVARRPGQSWWEACRYEWRECGGGSGGDGVDVGSCGRWAVLSHRATLKPVRWHDG